MEKILEKSKIEEFEHYLREAEKSQATVEKYIRDVRCFSSFVGNVPVCKQTVMEYKQKLARSFALSSANSMIAALNCFLRFCGRCDLCVKQFKVQRQAFCPEEKELSREEYLRLLSAANQKRNERLSLIIQTICGTGIRVSELEYITVEALRSGEAVAVCKGKSRRIFIVSRLRKKLSAYAKAHHITSGAIFITKKGAPISRNRVWKEMKALCSSARVSPSKVFPHNLRHLFARTFYKMEKDIAKLADILGHSSINTTRIYIVTTGAEHKRKMEHMHLII